VLSADDYEHTGSHPAALAEPLFLHGLFPLSTGARARTHAQPFPAPRANPRPPSIVAFGTDICGQGGARRRRAPQSLDGRWWAHKLDLGGSGLGAWERSDLKKCERSELDFVLWPKEKVPAAQRMAPLISLRAPLSKVHCTIERQPPARPSSPWCTELQPGCLDIPPSRLTGLFTIAAINSTFGVQGRIWKGGGCPATGV
jgi:hypothetical protein